MNSLSLSLQLSIRPIIHRIIATPLFTWLRLILANARSEVLDRALQFAVNWAARCVLISFIYIYLSLIFYSVTGRIGQLTDELRGAIVGGDFPRIANICGHLFFLAVELALVHTVIAALQRVWYFFCFNFLDFG
jgi:hypothetical protein